MIEQLRCRVVRVPLGAGPDPVSVVRALSGSDRLVALSGAWAGGGVLIASDPIVTAADIDALDRQPAVAGGEDGTAVGGGWFGVLAFAGKHRLAFYDHVLRLVDGQWWFEALWSDQRDAALSARRDELTAVLESVPVPEPVPAAQRTLAPFGHANLHEHLRAVETAIGSIRAGEIYQVNVCTRLVSPTRADGVELFARLTTLAPEYGAFVDSGARQIAGASPELFLRRRGRSVLTKPIKGTLPRDAPGNDEALRRSAKDAAENVMIVDLMRNDLGRVCEVGSVRASSLLDVEPHPGVWHLVSSVHGTLRPDVGDAELMQATFPPGSVTGAPKLRALAEIAAVEGVSREAYTGALGFASPVWGAEFSVAIRSFELSSDRVDLGVGGGITADSVPMLEWRECLHKAAPLLAAIGAELAAPLRDVGPPLEPWQREGGLLETILVAAGRPVRLADHLARLDRSARELYGHGVPADLDARVRAAAATAPGERAVLRVVLGATSAEVTVAALGVTPTETPVHTVHDRAGLWRHKWAERARFAVDEAVGAPLYVAADGTVLETSRGNVFLIQPDGGLVTPPLRDDLLPGITRRAVLDLARDEGRRVELRRFGLDEVLRGATFWTSSLSGAVAISAVDGHDLPREDVLVEAIRKSLIG